MSTSNIYFLFLTIIQYPTTKGQAMPSLLHKIHHELY